MTDGENIQMQINEASSYPDETILKQKPPRKPRPPLAPEVKAKLAENMRRVNAERIAAAKIRNEHKLDAKQMEVAKEAARRLEVIQQKKEAIKKLKECSPIPPPETPKVQKKSKKQVIIEVSSEDDSTDTETDDEEEEVLYVAKKKKSARAKSDNSIIKPKKQNRPQTPPQQEAPKPVIKFI